MNSKVLIAVSGSGGHILPARHLAEAMSEQGIDVLFVGSGRALETKLIDEFGFKRKVIEIQGVRRLGFLGLLKWLADLPNALRQLISIFRDFNPQLVIGFGGYATVLPVLYAKIKGIKTWIHEVEKKPGWANSLLGKIADRISVSNNESQFAQLSNAICTGQPLDRRFVELATRIRSLHNPIRVLITGGSQGAEIFDNFVLNSANSLKWHLFHQCRQVNEGKFDKIALKKAKPTDSNDLMEDNFEGVTRIEFNSFIQDMPGALSWCDILVCRGGANAIRDAIIARVPTIAVPIETSPEQHENCKIIESLGRGIVLREQDFNYGRIEDFVYKIIHEYPRFQNEMLDVVDDKFFSGTDNLLQAIIDFLKYR